MTNCQECPSCGAILTEIQANHNYLIELSGETNKWGKSDGCVEYTCGNCHGVLGIHDIEDILKQVDEL